MSKWWLLGGPDQFRTPGGDIFFPVRSGEFDQPDETSIADVYDSKAVPLILHAPDLLDACKSVIARCRCEERSCDVCSVLHGAVQKVEMLSLISREKESPDEPA